MKTVFIEARADVKVNIPKSCLPRLPEGICLATTVQFISQIKEIKRFLEDNGKKVSFFEGANAKYSGQVLGCSFANLKPVSCDAFLFVGDGKFHPIALAFSSDRPVFYFNPYTKVLSQVASAEIAKIRGRVKAGLAKFYSSTDIGVLVSLKQGQFKPISKLLELKKKFPEKNFYFLLFDEIDFSQLENFSFVECFINAACPRIGLDDSIRLPRPVINLCELSVSGC